jgi:DNA invertase Pin-like site-specific DNA recombinase
MKIGYARVSTKDQILDLQIDALEKAGCVKIFSEHISGAKATMPQLEACLEFLREGDTLVVWHIDRLNRTTIRLLMLHDELRKRNITLECLQLPVDFNDPLVGTLMLQLFSILAESERNIKIERSKAGMAAARARGRLGGRTPKLNPERKGLLIDAYCSRKYSIKELARMFDICVSSVMAYTQGFRYG